MKYTVVFCQLREIEIHKSGDAAHGTPVQRTSVDGRGSVGVGGERNPIDGGVSGVVLVMGVAMLVVVVVLVVVVEVEAVVVAVVRILSSTVLRTVLWTVVSVFEDIRMTVNVMLDRGV